MPNIIQVKKPYHSKFFSNCFSRFLITFLDQVAFKTAGHSGTKHFCYFRQSINSVLQYLRSLTTCFYEKKNVHSIVKVEVPSVFTLMIHFISYQFDVTSSLHCYNLKHFNRYCIELAVLLRRKEWEEFVQLSAAKFGKRRVMA